MKKIFSNPLSCLRLDSALVLLPHPLRPRQPGKEGSRMSRIPSTVAMLVALAIVAPTLTPMAHAQPPGGNESFSLCNQIRAELDAARRHAFALCGAVGTVVALVTVVTGGGALPASAYFGALCGGLWSGVATLEARYYTECG